MDGFKIALRYSLGHMVSYFRDRTHISTGEKNIHVHISLGKINQFMIKVYNDSGYNCLQKQTKYAIKTIKIIKILNRYNSSLI